MSVLKQGMLRGRGKQLLFADADGATRFSDIQSLENEMGKINTKQVRQHGGDCGLSDCSRWRFYWLSFVLFCFSWNLHITFQHGMAVVCGSRAHLEKESIVEVSICS